ncbi:voltage-dependent calcium channel subunit alpha-2/delta-3-like [Contarinia nasturtii]|uniref:voltage-dependent calcium channel subunit alpha-2/delta-3-like n=1 Tax=Contarinia nasturtii TaxID=265458 RepID=UPI0012D48137|nr:voltage-dependent calcium channel subunit alpha-2/delta-3-like [Contarinia nasturtii]
MVGVHNKNEQPFPFYFFSAIVIVIFLCHLYLVPVSADEKSVDHQTTVNLWASQFGDELYWLAKNMTRADEIKKEYKENNAKVKIKGELIRTAVEKVGRMFRRKIVAVRCIANRAEQLAEEYFRNYTRNDTGISEENLKIMRNNYTYYSSKYSTINGVPCVNRSETKTICGYKTFQNATYKPMILVPDKHFYHIKVNTTYSSVHVPTNVYDGSNETKSVIMWSDKLDEVFKDNYRNDPALSWQYFGSETGVLRHFPAKSWEDRDTSTKVDVYDCRKRSWYIETATCSKDIVILLDRTGSMVGYLGFVAKLTIKSLLDTFSNNDFFNIYTFSRENDTSNPLVKPLINCFDNKLVQATPENIKAFNEKMEEKHYDYNYANETHIKFAIETGFRLLKTYRETRKCNEIPCNQAIMLVTDNIEGNFTDTFETHNRINCTKIPVRIFTYLLGKDKSNVAEMKSIAMANRGGFSHIENLDAVQEKVFDYVETIAQPLVFQGEKHPPTWTHAFKDVTYRDEEQYVPANGKKVESPLPRLMISVGVPAYKINATNETRDYYGLLGVASTDVPVDDIDKLTLPYKLGVNAYPFIVSNNGFILLHPDLRPMETFKLKRDTEEIVDPQCPGPKDLDKKECVYLKNNYNSIDLTEVEQIDEEIDGNKSNEAKPKYRPSIGLISKELRNMSLNHEFKNMTNVSIRFHYDKMRRVSEEKYDYFFGPLESTPFTLGLAIPSTYGQTLITVGSEIQNNIHRGQKMSKFFVGQNWKVHPDWVYCKYHYMEYKSFDNSEKELLHFVELFQSTSMKWPDQYEQYTYDKGKDEEHPNCKRETTKKFNSDYYCNKELVELLVFDARVTEPSFRDKKWNFESDEAENLIYAYNATLRFVATMSGLTRWQFILGETEVEGDKEFGDYYTKAIDETWYRSAVLQHKSDNESFVYAVPHDDKDDVKEEGDIKVMASHAIFRMDAGKEAPACVVGFQFDQQSMYKRFKEITSQPTCDNCLQCDNEIYDCYVIDNNGYIILSNDSDDTGRFFGEVQGKAMKTLVDLNIFKAITVYDFQAICKIKLEENPSGSFANIISTPLQLLKRALQWMMTETILTMSNFNLWAHAQSSDNSNKTTFYNSTEKQNITKYSLKPCDKKATLYVMQQLDQKNNDNDWLYFSRIKLSNLLLVVVQHTISTSEQIRINAEAEEFEYDFGAPNDTHTFPCHKEKINELHSRRLQDCFTEDDREYRVDNKPSGSCTHHKINSISLIIKWSSVLLMTKVLMFI